MINFSQLKKDLAANFQHDLYTPLVAAINQRLQQYTHGEYQNWQQLIEQLPVIDFSHYDLLEKVSVGSAEQLNQQSKQQLIAQLKALLPWRKGPYELFGIKLDAEWRSDWKWQRLLPHISPLQNRTVLDVGCGNGYHCWRMLGQGAKLVIGIDPSQLFLAQFAVIKKYLPDAPVHLLPITLEVMPQNKQKTSFDSVFSMGVLYHRRSPIDHLIQLNEQLSSNGELILETLVIDGNEQQVLLPKDRYAQMRNVWFIPSAEALKLWLLKANFNNIRVVDINQTSVQEQRVTEWMQYQSLKDFLDPQDSNKTLEGYPAPKRCIIIANKA